MFGHTKQSASPATSPFSFLISADSLSIATSSANGPSMIAPFICPLFPIAAINAASTHDGIPTDICSVGAIIATFGVSIPSVLAVLITYCVIAVFCLKSGAGITATSDVTSNLWYVGISNTVT